MGREKGGMNGGEEWTGNDTVVVYSIFIVLFKCNVCCIGVSCGREDLGSPAFPVSSHLGVHGPRQWRVGGVQ